MALGNSQPAEEFLAGREGGLQRAWPLVPHRLGEALRAVALPLRALLTGRS